MIYPIFFSSKNNNNYIYDNTTRIVLPVNNYQIKDTDISGATLMNTHILQKIKEDYGWLPLFFEV